MWKCPKCEMTYSNSVKICPDCKYEQEHKPVILYIANILCTINLIWLIYSGAMQSESVGVLFWIGIIAIGVSLIGLWMFKAWGLYLLTGCFILIGFTFGMTNLPTTATGGLIILGTYISKAAWLD